MISRDRQIPGGIGILGGTFDPVHLGHIAVASAVRDQYNLSTVFLIPAFRNPLRMNDDTAAGPEHRLIMAEIAVKDEEGLDVDPIEIENGLISDEPSYTFHTLEHLKTRFPDKPLVLIVGADNVSFDMWHRADEFNGFLSRIAVVSRPDCETEMGKNLDRVRENLPGLAEIVEYLPVVDCTISSTAVRESLLMGVIPENCLHPDVEQYITEKCLYGLKGDAT